MITVRLRTVLFVLACLVLGVGVLWLLDAVTAAPEIDANTVALGKFSSEMMQRAGYGLRAILLGAFVTLVIVLWNASALSRDWLDVLSYAFKGFGVLAAFLLVALFLQQKRLQDVLETRHAEDVRLQKEVDDTEKTKAEYEFTRHERKRERVQAFLHDLAAWTDNVPLRKLAVSVAASHLRDDEMMSLGLAQALHSVALYDPDESIRQCVREMIYPGLSVNGLQVIPDFAEALVSLFETHPQLLRDAFYARYAGLIKLECREDKRLLDRLANIEAIKNEKVLNDTQLSANLKKPIQASTTSAADLAGTTDVIAAAASSSVQTQQKAIDLLQEADGSRLEAAVKLVPPELKSTVPPRVYVHVATADDRTKVTKLRDSLRTIKIGNQSPIVPGIQVVGSSAPEVTEVRYFAGEESRKAADKMVDFLKSNGIKNVRMSQEKPSESDLRQSRDISGHFEVWFAKGAVPP